LISIKKNVLESAAPRGVVAQAILAALDQRAEVTKWEGARV
jgi:hypothetical protein